VNSDIGVRLLSIVLLLIMRMHLRLFGFRRTMAVARKAANWTRAHDDADPVVTGKRIAKLVEQVATLLPGRMLCLEQSLTIFVLLRWVGLPATLRIGALVRPFVAHAWVEVGSVAINAEPEFLAWYQAFPELPR
jgi:hypothetical protein